VFTQIAVLTSFTTDWQFGMDKGQSGLLEVTMTGGRMTERLWHHDPWNFLPWPQQ